MDFEERKELVFSMKGDIFEFHKEFFGKAKVKIKNEEPRDLVTEADIAIDNYIVKRINEKFLNDKIIAEESGVNPGDSGYEWYIDAIDGTSYFAQGFKQYGTSIGLVYKGEIIFGVIFYAEDKKVYWAEKGKGAFCENDKIICKSKKDKLQECTMFSGLIFDSDKSKKVFDTFKAIYPKIGLLRVFGSCVSNLISIAKGEIDLFWEQEYLSPHDFCAGALIVKEAGGFVSHEDPNKFIYPTPGQLFASNGIVHKDFVELINKYYHLN